MNDFYECEVCGKPATLRVAGLWYCEEHKKSYFKEGFREKKSKKEKQRKFKINQE